MDDTRLRNEHERLQRLAEASGGVLAFTVSPTLRHYDATLNVAAPVGPNERYTIERSHRLSMVLPDNFPAQGPILRLGKPVLAPNIWPNGSPCLVENTWMPSQHLDQVICDLVEEMQGLAPNFGSVANSTAAALYARPGFLNDLRRRLGPPIRLVPPTAPRAGGAISTVRVAAGVGGEPRSTGIQTVRAAATTGITTIRSVR